MMGKLILDVIHLLLLIIGFVTTVGIACEITESVIIPKVKEINKRQVKIRWLCDHQYKEEYGKELEREYYYDLICMKCGKRKSVNFYKKKV